MSLSASRFIMPAAARRLCLLVVLFPALAHADVVLEWDPNTETDLAGYKVYYGTAPGVYRTPITIGLQNTYTFPSLAPGTYYFAVTARNTQGLESGFSNQVSAVVGSTSSPCDLNGDGRIDVRDLQVLTNVILLTRTCPGNCDRNGDGQVDVVDLQALANVILGLRSCP